MPWWAIALTGGSTLVAVVSLTLLLLSRRRPSGQGEET